DTDFKTFTAPDHSDAFSMQGARNDVLVAGEGSVYLRHLRFDAWLRRQKEPRTHLFSTSSLLDGAEIHRSHWVFGTGDFSRTPVAYSWIVYGPDRWRGSQLSVPYGLMLACDGATVWGVRRSHLMRGKPGGEGKYLLFAARRPEASESRPDFRKEGLRFAWTAPLPLRPRAMVRAGESLLVAGMTDAFDAGDPSAPCNAVFQGEGGGRLYVADARTGKDAGAQPLDAAPVWDGMAVAGGRLYVALADGTLVCLGAP
ncbi:MAG: PQQ-binding-like beta-propeller repeat protein, partial [Planctomycetota bacterium]|nr:PQQ-binding-like beta-propeller repeat protein [Planctomycetota bacterium]